MKHFTCLTTSYPQEGDPLAGHFVESLHEYFVQAAWRPKVVTFHRGTLSRATSRPTQHIGMLGEDIFLSPTWGESVVGGAPDHISAHPLRSLGAMPLNAWRLDRAYRHILTLYPELTHAPVIAHWSIPCGWLARHQRPMVYCHGGDVALLERLPLGAHLTRQILKNARGVVCVSNDLRQRLLTRAGAQSTRYQEKLYTLPMGISDPEPDQNHLARYQQLSSGRLMIATVGRLSKIKGYHLLVESLGVLTSEERSRLIWIAGGDGPERSEIEQLARRLQVPLITEGLISPPQRDALYQACDLFIAPSIRVDHRVEGMPLALREAALNGCQIMTTSLGGVREVIHQLPKDAVVEIEPEVSSLKEAIRAWLTSEERSSDRLTRRVNRQRDVSSVAKALWAWRSIGPQHLALFERLHAQ